MDSLLAEPRGKPKLLEWVAYSFSRASSWPKTWTGVSCIASRFFTSWATREAHKDINKCVLMLVTQSFLTLCDPMDCSPPGFSLHRFLQSKVLEWVAIPFSRGSSQPQDWTQISCIASRFFAVWASREIIYKIRVTDVDNKFMVTGG